MRAALRILILIPLGILAAACAAMLAAVFLSVAVPEFGDAFAGALFAAWSAFIEGAIQTDDPQALGRITLRIWSLSMMILFAPAVIAAIIGELTRLRGALAHMVLTGALTVLLPLASGASTRAVTAAEARALASLFFVGVAAGLVYWMIAGRSAAPASRPVESPPA